MKGLKGKASLQEMSLPLENSGFKLAKCFVKTADWFLEPPNEPAYKKLLKNKVAGVDFEYFVKDVLKYVL
jgi:hypothetical protein